MFAAIRRALSLVSSLAADRPAGLFLVIDGYALDAEQSALVAKANTGGQQTCRGYLTTNSVNDR
jgi:hypothetical protein